MQENKSGLMLFSEHSV